MPGSHKTSEDSSSCGCNKENWNTKERNWKNNLKKEVKKKKNGKKIKNEKDIYEELEAYGNVPVPMSFYRVITLAMLKDERKIALLFPFSETKKKNPSLQTIHQMIVPWSNSSKAISMKRNRLKTKKK